MDEVRVGCRTRTAHGTTFSNYPLPCPRCSLPRPLCSPNAALASVPLVAPSLCSGQPFVPLSPCPRLRCTLPATHLSLSLSPLPPPGTPAPRLVARWSLRTPLRPSSLFARLASPSLSCPVSPLPLAGYRVGKSHARTWPSWYVSTLRSALSGAPAYWRRLARQWGTFVLLPHAHPFMPPWHALVPALPSLPLRPPASASTLRSISRGSALPLPPLSVLAPWPCSAPCLLTLPRPHLPPFPCPLVPGPQCPCPRLPFTPPACISRSNTRGTPHSPFTLPLPGSLVLSAPQPAALFSRPTSPSLPCPCPSLFLPVVPSLDTLSACRTHVAGSLPAPPFLPRPFPPHLHAGCFAGLCVGKLHARRRHAPGPRRATLRGADLFAATRRGSPPCPLPLRIAGGSLGGGAPLSFRPTLALLCRRGTCPALLCLPLCPPASTSTMRSNSRGSAPSLPSLSALAPWPRPAPRLLALPRPLVPPRSLGHWPSVSVSPSSLHPPCLHFAEQFARHPSNCPSTLPLPGALVPSAPARSLRPSSPALSPPPSPALFLLHTPQYTSQDTLLAYRMHVAGTRLAPPSPPCPVLSLHYAGHSAKHCVDTSHACRRHAPGLYWRRRREGWLHAVTARRCRSPRGSRRRGQPLHMPRGARPW